MVAAKHVLSGDAAQAIWRLAAEELVAEYAAGRLSPLEALAACFGRIEAVNPRLNAIVTIDEAGASEAARTSTERWRLGTPLGPLDGVPITVKDNITVKGMRATWGSKLYADFVPATDELPIARLRAGGAVIVGKTNVPEFTLHGYTDNLLFGPTRNPWDLRLTPGGSSGGAAAAVAAGMAPLAVGTDGGGSIRRPACHAGLVGLKPSTGRVARCDGFAAILHDFEVVGPIARTTAGAAKLTAAMSGADSRDHASLALGPLTIELARLPEPQRILYVAQFDGAPVDPEVAASVAAAATNLERLGHRVVAGRAPFDGEALNRAWPVVGGAGLVWLLRRHAGWRDQISPQLRDIAQAGERLSAADYVEALDVLAELRRRLGEFFERYDLMLTPSAAALPWPAETSHPATIDGKPVGPRGHAVFTGFVNAAGVPAINIPSAPSSSGLPIGFQLVGAHGSDGLLLRMSAQYEGAHPWADRWPHIP